MSVAGYTALMFKQRPIKSTTTETNDLVRSMNDRLDHRLDQLHSDLSAHVQNNVADFARVWDKVGEPKRRRGWLLPAIGILIRAFFR